MVVRFLTNKGKLSFNNIYLKGAFYFTIYSLIVSLFYFAFSLDYKYILPSFNYIYCFIFLVFIADLTKKELFFNVYNKSWVFKDRIDAIYNLCHDERYLVENYVNRVSA